MFQSTAVNSCFLKEIYAFQVRRLRHVTHRINALRFTPPLSASCVHGLRANSGCFEVMHVSVDYLNREVPRRALVAMSAAMPVAFAPTKMRVRSVRKRAKSARGEVTHAFGVCVKLLKTRQSARNVLFFRRRYLYTRAVTHAVLSPYTCKDSGV